MTYGFFVTPLRLILASQLFRMIDFHFSISGTQFDILPDWLGQCFLILAIYKLQDKGLYHLIPLSLILVLAEWTLIEISITPFHWMYLIPMICQLYVQFTMLTYVCEIARRFQCYSYEGLGTARMVSALVTTVSTIFMCVMADTSYTVTIEGEIGWIFIGLLTIGLVFEFLIAKHLFVITDFAECRSLQVLPAEAKEIQQNIQ